MMYPLLLALPTFEGLTKIAVFLLMLSILIVLHEYGHFIIARINGVRVNDFAVGFGPTLLKWTSPRSGTNYRINAFPVGGYCAMQGEDGKTSEAEQQRSFIRTPGESDNFQAKSPWQRLAIVLAGPIANFILAFVILLASALMFGVPNESASAMIGPILDGSPAKRAGLHFQDVVVSIDGVPVVSGDKMVDTIHASAGKMLHLKINRHGAMLSVAVTPARVVVAGGKTGKTQGQIGFRPMPSQYRRIGVGEALSYSWMLYRFTFVNNIMSIGMLVANPVAHFGSTVGIVGMGYAAGQLQDLGGVAYLEFAAMISMALGIFNLLPIPALDGGRASFIVAELIRGRPVNPEREALVHVAGFAVLMALMVLVAFHDIANLIAGKGVF